MLHYAAPSGTEDDAVIKLRALKNDGDTLWCTATLIAPNLAAHGDALRVRPSRMQRQLHDRRRAHSGSADGVFGEPFVPSNITVHVGAGEEEPVAAIGEKIFHDSGAVHRFVRRRRRSSRSIASSRTFPLAALRCSALAISAAKPSGSVGLRQDRRRHNGRAQDPMTT